MAIFIVCYAITIAAVIFARLEFGFQHRILNILPLFVSAYSAAIGFIHWQKQAPTWRDTLVLSLSSLGVFWVFLLSIQYFAATPFNLTIFLLQTATVFVVSYVIYGVLAKKLLAGFEAQKNKNNKT